MSSAPCLAGVFSLCFFLFVTIWVTSLGSILRSCYFAEFSITQCFRGPQMVRCASAFKPAPARAHSSGYNQIERFDLHLVKGRAHRFHESPLILAFDVART